MCKVTKLMQLTDIFSSAPKNLSVCSVFFPILTGMFEFF